MNIVIFITCTNNRQAKKIAKELLKERLVACVNIVDKIDSFFWWQGKVDSAREVLLIAKSKKTLMPGIIRQVKLLHSYQVPEVIALPIIAGNKDYIKWINQSCQVSP
ncbi:MAG: divalent-cation tolerance protein CutA [Candidatus Omnitrophica bacterium]|nr:divalent-cation tolerance protein CutA [Candidatus Omnitrophota bacterium]MBU1871517.1 divalent-cation tolerance protein CutA [Candidatus Omnitrophota bacterium]